MKTVEEYITAIDDTFTTTDTTAMRCIVDNLKLIDKDIAYNVLTTAMGIGSSIADVDIKKVRWVHSHAIDTLLEILRDRQLDT